MKFWLILFISLSAFANPSWIEEQIEADLKDIAPRSVTTQQIDCYFKKLSDEGAQALHGSIRNNQIHWQQSLQKDLVRNPHIFAYFNELSRKYLLPNIDFILLTGDGYSSSMELPVFGFSALPNTNVCLFPDFEMFYELEDLGKDWKWICQKLSKKHPWHTKLPHAFFRGAGTGQFINDPSIYYGNNRMRAVAFSIEFPNLLDASLTSFQTPFMAQAYSQLGKSVGGASIDTHFHYKYLLDIDGNANTYSRCRWILLSNSVLVKVTSLYQQWYYRAMQPWVHYVPIEPDLSNLKDSLQILIENDALAYQIAKNGQKLGRQLFSSEVVETYVTRLLLAYAKKITISQ